MSDGLIYESDTVESLIASNEFDAAKWAAQFVAAVARQPALATDRETMLSWFAGAIMTGYDRGTTAEESLVRAVELLRELSEKWNDVRVSGNAARVTALGDAVRRAREFSDAEGW